MAGGTSNKGFYRSIRPRREGVGSASIFRRAGGEWKLEQVLSEAKAFRFGLAVRVVGERVIVGTLGWDENAFVYRHTAEGWIREGVLRKPASALGESNFGSSIDFDGSTAVIAAPFANFTSIFQRDGKKWHERATLKLPIAEANDAGAERDQDR
jgi:hypothetical protein